MCSESHLGNQKWSLDLYQVFLHIIVYVGFIIINIEVLEIIIDGLFGTHLDFFWIRGVL